MEENKGLIGISKDEIKKTPDLILNDKSMLKEVIKDPLNTIELLKAKGETIMNVEVDGQEIELVRPVILPETIDKIQKMRKM